MNLSHVGETTERDRPALPDARITVVLPLFNEVAVLERLHTSLCEILDRTGAEFELIFVNDGSTDGSQEILDSIAATNRRVQVLHLSRNFGHQAALHAGLLQARGDAVIVMDTDLQDDPRCLPVFLERWQEGYDVVYAIRTHRKENAVKRLLFFGFYRLLNRISTTPLPNDAGNFGLLDRRVVDQLADLPECDRFFPGLRSWVGFRQIGLPVERQARHDARPRVTLAGLFRLAKTAIFSFSSAPLVSFYAISMISLLICGGLTCFTLYHKLITGLAIPGWTSTVGIAAFFGALNALGIGILGEYVVRIYDQVRGRPKFIIARRSIFAEAVNDKAEDRAEQEIAADLAELSAALAVAAAYAAPLEDLAETGAETIAHTPRGPRVPRRTDV